MKKIKVIHISTSIHPGTNSSNYIEKITNDWYGWEATRIKALNKNLDMECWTFEDIFKENKEIVHKNIKFRIFPCNLNIRHSMGLSGAMISALKFEEKKAKENNTKLILHIHEYHCWQSLLILLFKSKSTSVIAQHHGARTPLKNMMKYKRLFLAFPYVLLMEIFEKLLLGRANIFYALSDEEISYLKKVASNSKIVFRTMGIDDDYFKLISKLQARRKLKLELNRDYLLYLGRIKATKGIKELLDALKDITNKKITLFLIGEGVDLKKFKDYSEANSITNVVFLGPKYSDEKKLFLSASDCLVLPSHTEGAPVVLMEAIARNLPVIATNVGGIPKMIKNRREGLIIKPHSKEEIKKAVMNILSWKSKNIQNYAKKYSWQQIIKDTVADYYKLK
jgi:glycosyltransferase involved in cell wall biosynthesis